MKTKNNLIAALIATAFLTVSCVENSLSPQVEAIRAQQVEWMKAKTATELALGDYQKAQTTLLAAQQANQDSMTAAQVARDNAYTAGQILTNKQTEKLNELAYNLAKSQNATALKQAEAALAQADLNLKTAMNELAIAVTKSGDDQAQEYYTQYSAQASSLEGLNRERLAIQSNLASNSLSLASKTFTLDQFKKTTQASIDQNNVTLSASKLALASLNSVLADPTTIQAEINTLTNANTDLTLSFDKLNVDVAKATIAETLSQNKYNDGQAIIAKMISLKNQHKTNTLNLALNLTNVTNANTDLKNYKSNLTNLTAIYNQEKTSYDAKVVAYDDAKALKDDAQYDYNLKLSATNIAYNNWDKVTADANKTKYTNAKTISDAALIVLNTMISSLNTATTSLNAANSSYFSAKANLTTTENNISSTEDLLASLNKTKSELDLEKINLDKDIAGLTSSYNTEYTNQFKYAQDVISATNAITALDIEMAAITTKKQQNNTVITALLSSKNDITNSNNDIKSAIETVKTTIANTEKSIAEATQSLSISSTADAKSESERLVAKLTKDLEAINVKITASEKLVTYWKNLLDSIFKA